MPQLNPDPWFSIMILSWTTMLMVFSPKITTALPQNPPILYHTTSKKTLPWNWLWS